MHRHMLLEDLARYRRHHAPERATVLRMEQFIEAQERCFDRGLTVGHVTGSAWLVDPTGTRVLLTHHRKLGRWLQLGGHADGDANVLRVALREATEESGLTGIEPVSKVIFDLDIHPIPPRGEEPAHLHYDVRYALRAVDGSPVVVSDESNDLAWVEITRLATRTDEPTMLRMAGKWLKRRDEACLS